MTITPEEFSKKLEAMKHTKKVDILKKIANFCHKEYNDNSDWDSWSFRNFLWSEWEIRCNQEISLIGNAKVLVDSQIIAHVKVFCGLSSPIPRVKVTSTLFDLRTGQIKEITKYEKHCVISKFWEDPEFRYYTGSENSDKQEEITFIREKTDKIVETISSFAKSII